MGSSSRLQNSSDKGKCFDIECLFKIGCQPIQRILPGLQRKKNRSPNSNYMSTNNREIPAQKCGFSSRSGHFPKGRYGLQVNPISNLHNPFWSAHQDPIANVGTPHGVLFKDKGMPAARDLFLKFRMAPSLRNPYEKPHPRREEIPDVNHFSRNSRRGS